MKRIVAALAAAALVTAAALAGAGEAYAGTRHGRHSGAHVYAGYHSKHRPYDRYGYGYRHWPRYRHHRFRHHRFRHHRHGHHHGGVALGLFTGGIVLGHLLSRPSYAPAPPVATPPALSNCLPTTGTGTWYGRPALFRGTMCYDAAGRAYILNTSVRFLRYLD